MRAVFIALLFFAMTPALVRGPALAIEPNEIMEDPALEGVAAYLVPLDIIETDPARALSISETVREAFSSTWWGYPDGAEGYKPPDEKGPIEEFIDESTITIWNVRLTMIADDDDRLLRLVGQLRSSEVHKNPLSYIGKLFMEMGEYQYAEQFLIAMLRDSSVRSHPARLLRVHNGPGANYIMKGDYDTALEQYQKALDVSRSYLPPMHTDLASFYDAIGKSYFQLGNYKKAVENYEKAIELIEFNGLQQNNQFSNDLNDRIDNVKKLLNE